MALTKSMVEPLNGDGPQPLAGSGAIYTQRAYAEGTVEVLARFGIVAEVLPDGSFWRVAVYSTGAGRLRA